MYVNALFRQSCLKRKLFLCKCIPMSFLPSPTPYHFRSHPSQAEEERRPDDVCKPDAGTQKTWCRSRLILHSSVAMNSAHLGHQRKRHEYPTVARLAVSPKVFPLLKFPSFLKHIVYDELLTTDGYPIPTLQKDHQEQPLPKCSHGALSFLPQVLVKGCWGIPQLPIVIYEEGAEIH